MMSPNIPLTGWYDYRAVTLSVLVAIFSSYAAFEVAGRMTAAHRGARWLWWIGGTIALAFGIRSMHYSALLAFKLPVPIAYDLPTGVLSYLPALAGSAVALYVLSVPKVGLLRTCIAGIVSGGGIAGLHYAAMASMRSSAVPRYDPLMVVWSIVLAIVFSVIALRLAFSSYDLNPWFGWRKIAGAVIMGAGAISGMHYTGMAAVKFTASGVQPDVSHAVSGSFLGIAAISLVTFIMQALAILTSAVDRRFHSQHELSARILQSQDEERRRISQHLHETVAQSLVALKMNLAKINRSGIAKDAGVHATLAESIELADESMRQVRTLSYLLHPPLMEEIGLLSALRWYVSGFRERSGIAVTLKAPRKLERLPEETETAVFRIVQECLTNIHRHSGSPSATIRLTREASRLVLQVEDAGTGMPDGVSADLRSGYILPGVGIAGIRERVHQLGGEMKIDSTVSGTDVIVTLPLKSA